MYNPDQKELFLQNRKDLKKESEYRSLFEKSEVFEKKASKDLLEFSREELISFLNSLVTTDPQGAKKKIHLITTYKSFFGEDLSSPDISKYDLDFITPIKKTVYKNHKKLLSDIESVAPFNEGFFVGPALCFAWLGISQKDATKILKDDVDLIWGKLKVYGEEISIPEDMLLKLREYQNTKVSYRTQNQTFEVYAQDSPYFLRRMVTKNSKKGVKEISYSSLSTEIYRAKALFGLKEDSSKLDYSLILKSGRLQRLYLLEKSGIDIFSAKNRDVAQNVIQDKKNYSDYFFLYQKYKEAFSLR